MDQELHHELRPERIERYRDEAKMLLRAVRGGDAVAAQRAREALGDRVDDRFVLADALHVVALEHGHRSWPAFKHDLAAHADGSVRPVGRIGVSASATYPHGLTSFLTPLDVTTARPCNDFAHVYQGSASTTVRTSPSGRRVRTRGCASHTSTAFVPGQN